MTWLVIGLCCLALAVGIAISDRLRRGRDEAQAYLKGVRYMLSDDPDAAIEAISDGARLGAPSDVETYLALGALFRRTGDLTRAIRLHRNLLMRPGLPGPRRVEVERELALDLRRGGLLRESADRYRALLARGDAGAAEGLREVLLDQGDIAGAVEAQRTACASGVLGAREELARLLACQALDALEADPTRARGYADASLAASPGNGLARLILAELEARAGNAEPTLGHLRQVLSVAPALADLAWPTLTRLGARDRAAVDAFLAERADASPDAGAIQLLRGRWLIAGGRTGEAITFLGRALELDRGGELAAAVRRLLKEAGPPSPEAVASWHALMMTALERPARAFRCRRCRAEVALRAWRCERCAAFDAFALEPTA
jgi:lipopolysaccharide biosynthesis regulator YciM